MQEVRIFEIRGTPENLRKAASEEDLLRSLRALATDITARASGGPLSIYVCSSDADKAIRDHLAVMLARAIVGRLPKTLVVDCDFLHPGLSGVIPQPTALGLLDLVLYGSSLGVITQRAANGVAVVGAGSFAVPKRTPFLMDAFDDAARYLCRPAGCVIFCGPAVDDDEAAHAIGGHVGLPIVIESLPEASPGRKTVTALASKVASAKGSLVWSVRISQPTTPAPPSEETQPIPLGMDGEVDELLSATMVSDPKDTGLATAIPPQRPPVETPSGARSVPYREETLDERSGSSVVPRVVTTLLAVFVVGFLLWWLHLTKSMREDADPAADVAGSTRLDTVPSTPEVGLGAQGGALAMPDSVASIPVSTADGDEARESAADSGVAEVEPPKEPASGPAVPVERDIVAPELSAYAGKYLVHVSSFRGLNRAEDDADYLKGRGYETLIAHVDVGDKGLWYRVYVGPFQTEREADLMKIRLDENPRVRSTRITKVPSQTTEKDE